MFGHQSMPLDVRRKIARDVQEVLADAKISQRIELTGQDVSPAGPDELAAVLKRQFTYAELIARELGLQPGR